MFKTTEKLLMNCYIEWKRLNPSEPDEKFSDFLNTYVKPFINKKGKE